MALDGLLTEVLITERGSHAATDAPLEATQVEVSDVTDFTDYTAEDTSDPATQETTGMGVVVDILGERYTVESVTPGAADDAVVLGAGEDYDLAAAPTPGTLTLTEPLRVAVDEGDPVWIVLGTEVATDAYALVSFPQTAEVLGEETEAGDVAQVPIPYGMRASFPEGITDPPVPLVVAEDLSQVLDAPGVRPVIDGSIIINLPGGGDRPTEPPESSPAVEVHGTADALVIEVTEEFAGTTTLDFHISTSPDFEPSEETLAGSARSAVYVIVELPDGSRLELNTPYYVRTVARNELGAAGPGPVAVGSLDPSVVSEVVAARLVAGFVLAGAIQVGNITIDPVNGIVVPQSNGGVIHLPADGSAATVDAHINARSLNIEDDLAIGGYGELGGDLQLRTGISNPQIAPTVTSGWPSYPIPTMEDWPYPPNEMGVWQDPATGEGRIAMLNSGSTGLNIFRTSDRTLIQTLDMPFARALGSSEMIVDLKVERGLEAGDANTYLWVLIGNWSTDTIQLRRYTFGNFTTANRTRSNVASGGSYIASLAPMGDEMWVVYNVWNSGVYIRGYNAASSTLAPLPGTWPIKLSNSNITPDAAAANVFPSELYLTFLERPGTIFTWTHDDDMDPNTPPGGDLPDINHSFTQVTAQNMTSAFSGEAPVALATSGGDGHVYAWYYDARRFVIHRAPYEAPTPAKAGYTWYDPDPNGGTHETLLSPLTTYTTPRGAWPSLSVPKPPEADITDPTRVDKATHVGLYVGPASVANAQLPRLAYRSSAQRNMPLGSFLPTGNGSTNYPPATNQFLLSESTPGRIYSAATDTALNPLVDLRGDGSWRLGSLSGNAAGRVSDSNGVGLVARLNKPNQSIPNATETTVTWGASRSAPYTDFSRWFTMTNNILALKPGQDGVYDITAFVYWGSSGTPGTRRIVTIDWAAAGTSTFYRVMRNDGIAKATAAAASGVQVTATIPLQAGDRIEIVGYQDSGAALAQSSLSGPEGASSGFLDLSRRS